MAALWYLETWEASAFLDGHILWQYRHGAGCGAMCLASMCFHMLGFKLASCPHSAHWNSDLPITMILDWICSSMSSSDLRSEQINYIRVSSRNNKQYKY